MPQVKSQLLALSFYCARMIQEVYWQFVTGTLDILKTTCYKIRKIKDSDKLSNIFVSLDTDHQFNAYKLAQCNLQTLTTIHIFN